MSKRNLNELSSLIILFSLLIHFTGLKYTLNLFYQLLKSINIVLIQLNNTSVLSVLFKYCITFPTVGIILTVLGSPRGKEGHIIGKILYFIVGYLVGFIFDNISQLIF